MILAGTEGARAGVVLLHGRGGRAAEMPALLDHAGVSGLAVAAPEAPGQSWWPTSFLAPAAQMEPFVARGLETVAGAVAALQAAGIDRAAIWLAGFSPGACLALEAHARIGAGLAGAFGFSGGLVGTADAGPDPDPSLYGHPPKRFDYGPGHGAGRVWISVHARDPHIPLRRAEDTAEVFRGLGATVATEVHPGAGHGLREADLAILRDWLGPG